VARYPQSRDSTAPQLGVRKPHIILSQTVCSRGAGTARDYPVAARDFPGSARGLCGLARPRPHYDLGGRVATFYELTGILLGCAEPERAETMRTMARSLYTLNVLSKSGTRPLSVSEGFA
jgi:hypothetical protein